MSLSNLLGVYAYSIPILILVYCIVVVLVFQSISSKFKNKYIQGLVLLIGYLPGLNIAFAFFWYLVWIIRVIKKSYGIYRKAV